MKNIVFCFLFVNLICCSTSQQISYSTPQQKSPSPVIHLDDHVLNNGNTSAAWLGYGAAIAAWEPVYTSVGELDLCRREIEARATAALIWKELKQNGSAYPDADLDALEKVADAGFMKEYVWHFLREKGWLRPEDLNINQFVVWAKKHIPSHKPIKDTGVLVTGVP